MPRQLHAYVTTLALLSLLSLVAPRAAEALETDQFTPPRRPLADVGPEVSREVMRRIEIAVARVNDRTARHLKRADAAGEGFWRRHHLREAERESGERALAAEVYRELAGPGLPECHLERWIRKHRFANGPARHEMSSARSVYGPSPLARSPFIVSLSPTVNVFGVYCGADKMGHLVQQGYQYFDTFIRAEERAASGTHAAALAAAVKRGVDQERGFYGLALVGVYSNADLAANYAGLKLYLNLTRPVSFGGPPRPALLVRENRRWVFNGDRSVSGGGVSRGADRSVEFLRPFVSDHFNEALNPPLFSRPTRETVRTRWRARGAEWAAFYGSTPPAEAKRLHALATWHGEPYGHSGFGSLVTALDTCFANARQPVRPPSSAAAPAAGARTPSRQLRRPAEPAHDRNSLGRIPVR
jgi:hypothetical protein